VAISIFVNDFDWIRVAIGRYVFQFISKTVFNPKFFKQMKGLDGLGISTRSSLTINLKIYAGDSPRTTCVFMPLTPPDHPPSAGGGSKKSRGAKGARGDQFKSVSKNNLLSQDTFRSRD
jgi:hypothetical protein